MQTVLEQGSIDKPLTFDVGLIQLSFIPVCSLNTCNISVKLCRGFAALQCFSLYLVPMRRTELGKCTITSERIICDLQSIPLVSVVWDLSVVGGMEARI